MYCVQMNRRKCRHSCQADLNAEHGVGKAYFLQVVAEVCPRLVKRHLTLETLIEPFESSSRTAWFTIDETIARYVVAYGFFIRIAIFPGKNTERFVKENFFNIFCATLYSYYKLLFWSRIQV